MAGAASKWPYLDAHLPIPMAHRGAHLAASENSLRSFSAAQQLGYKYIETDVRGTADRKIVVFHDANAYRMTGLRAEIAQRTLKQLLAAPLIVNGSTELPLLEDTLGAFPGLRFNIDVKDSIAASEIARVIRRTNSYDRVCITSFSTRRIRRARAGLDRDVCTGAGLLDVMKFLISSRTRAARRDVAVLQLPLTWRNRVLVSGRLIDKAHAAGLQVHVWTVNDRASITRALDLGVDGIISDEPALLKEELTSRGLWMP